MKLRIYRNSIRLRLGPEEVSRLRQKGSISETTAIGPGVDFLYTLKSCPIAATKVTLESNQLSVELPQTAVSQWASGDEVQINTEQDAGRGRTLKVLIEKDFECLHPEMNEPGAKFYPNPNNATAK